MLKDISSIVAIVSAILGFTLLYGAAVNDARMNRRWWRGEFGGFTFGNMPLINPSRLTEEERAARQLSLLGLCGFVVCLCIGGTAVVIATAQ